MMETILSVLAGFLSGYLHQDWHDEWSDPIDAARHFGESDDPGIVAQGIGEISLLLARNISEDELTTTLDAMGCYFYPRGAGMDPAAWLRQLQTAMIEVAVERYEWRS